MKLTMLPAYLIKFRTSRMVYETMFVCCNVKKTSNLLALTEGTPMPPGAVTRHRSMYSSSKQKQWNINRECHE